MILQILVYLVAIIFLFVLIIDIVPIMKDWVSRIKIGKYENNDNLE